VKQELYRAITEEDFFQVIFRRVFDFTQWLIVAATVQVFGQKLKIEALSAFGYFLTFLLIGYAAREVKKYFRPDTKLEDEVNPASGHWLLASWVVGGLLVGVANVLIKIVIADVAKALS